jgi:tetratricopeptide (TPR) repeat protein
MYKFSSAVFTFVILFFAFNAFAQDETRASKTWDVQRYDLTATLPQTDADRNLNAKAVLNLKNVGSGAASRLTLRISPNAEVSAVRINDSAADFTKGEEKIGTGALQRIILRTPSVAPNGNLTVAVDYKLKVDENSGLNAISPINSQFLPLSFWYPTPNSWYFARGGDYAPFRIQVNAPNNLTVISSGNQNANAFEQKINGQPFFAAGNWDPVNANNISVFIPKGSGTEEQKRASELAALANDARTFTANLLGAASEIPLRIVSVKRGAGFSGSGTIFVDDSVFRRQKIDSLTAMTIAEAVAKTWLGNSVAVSGDGFGVIREGLSRFIATKFIESKYGKEIADIERLRQRTAYAAIVRRDAPLNIVSPLDDYYFPEVANKGAMVWRILEKKVGQEEFFNTVRENMKDGSLDVAELRAAFSSQKPFLDYSFEQITDMNLLVGLPQANGAETKVALRNTGSTDATVNVIATTQNGENLTAQATIPAKSFGEVIFKTNNKVIRTEVDRDKFYPQTNYSDDIAPRQFDESDFLLVIKRAFDKQDFANAEKNARLVLQLMPRFDDARVFLARSLLAQGKTAEAEKEFQAVLNENLPTARSLAWANVGLGEVGLKNGQAANAAKYFAEAIKIDAEYGATLAARQGRIKTNAAGAADENVKNFFAQFDKAAISNRKSEIEALVVPGEVVKFAGGISGQTEQWQTKVLQVDKIDENNVLVETNLNIKLLNREPETGTAVYRLSKIGNLWKLSSVEMFEVR